MSIRVLLADDHHVVRAGLRLLLSAEEDIEVVAEAADVDEMLRAVLGHKPDVLVLGLAMSGTLTAVDALPHVRRRSANTATVVLTMHTDPILARSAFRSGALGYVLKGDTGDEFLEAVRSAASGEVYLNGRLTARLALLPESPLSADNLSERETAVLHLIALGHTNAEIGERMFLSVRTVESHRATLQHKLGRSTRAELVRYALSHGGIGEA